MQYDAVELLCHYIRLNTTNPPGNEYLAAEFFERIFYKEGVTCKTYEPRQGRVSIRAEIKGSGEKEPIILLHHMDVVSANREEWSFDPFGGEIINDYICGRGALDTKSLGILQLLTFLEIKHRNLKLSRDLIFLASADEESGGDCGVEHLLRNFPGDFKSTLVLNEGSYIVSDIASKPVAMIATSEKGPCWLKLKRRGIPGHGSTPHGQNPLEKMIQALNRLIGYDFPIYITPVVAEYFKRLANVHDFLKPYQTDGNIDTLIQIIIDNGLLAKPQDNALLRNTISLNILKSGDKVNVIPSSAEAVVDIRLLPGQHIPEIMALVKKLLSDGEISIEPICQFEGNTSPMDTDSFYILETAIHEHYPDAVITPYMMTGTSDSRFFRDRGITAYGFCPTTIPKEDLQSIHGIDEKIRIGSLLKGIEVYQDAVQRLCT